MFDQSEDNPNDERVEAAKKKVLDAHSDATAEKVIYDAEVWQIRSMDAGLILGEGDTEEDAWIDAASLPIPVEPTAQVEEGCKCGHGRDHHMLYNGVRGSGFCGYDKAGEMSCQCQEFEGAQVESASVEPKTDVYEVFGSCATSRGWDFLVCTTLSNAMENIADSLDSLEEDEEVKIVFRRYTKGQMEEVIYE